MNDPMILPRRPELGVQFDQDGSQIIIWQDTGGQEPEDTPTLYVSLDDARRLGDWLRGALPSQGD